MAVVIVPQEHSHHQNHSDHPDIDEYGYWKINPTYAIGFEERKF